MFLRNKNSYLFIGAVAIIFLAGILFFDHEKNNTPDAQAAATENVMGFAWSENIGWISFNSLGCDTNNNGFIDIGACGGNDNATTPSISYGVNLNADKTLSGYAWSSNIGWISFNTIDVAGCPSLPCQPSLSGSDFSGWARALAFGGGWDGWISLRNNVIPYGVALSGTDFEGFAWSDMVIGWISFNSKNCDPLGAGSSGIGGCPLPVGTPIPAYKVYLGNNRPVVSNLAIDKDYCVNDLNSIQFSWSFSDAEDDIASIPQSAYQIDLERDDLVACSISENNDNLFITRAKINKATPPPNCPGFIDYNHSYTWSVTVWDSGGLPSVTVNSAPPAFETPTHQYPRADFSFTPALPLQFQDIDFDPNILSEAFGGFSIDKWIWNFGDLTPFRVINNPLGDTIYFYAEADDYMVDLEVTDNSPELYSCWASDRNNEKLITVELSKPTWNEVEPE